MNVSTAIFLALAAGFAGFVDALVGGGGLIQLPALFIGLSGRPIPLILATNKVPAILGTTTAAVNYWRRVRPDPKVAVAMALPAFLGSMVGAHFASIFPAQLFKPIIVVALVSVLIYTIKKPELGLQEMVRFTLRARLLIVATTGLIVGLYDGLIGPGTGSFLIFILVGMIGYAFLRASATAKLVNIATNLGAIITFQISGHIWWHLGLLLAIANVSGAILGSRLAIRGGSQLVRRAYILITVALIARLIWGFFASN